jgi:hypothetical protein
MFEEILTTQQIEKMIYVIRGQKVMLDIDLANMYGVEVKRLNEQVRRNLERFPEDFAFQPTFNELADLRSQIATEMVLTSRNYIKHSPYLFTENGVAMLSSVLNSPRAIAVNITIIRIFTKLRSYLLLENETEKKLNDFKQGTTKMFKVVFERLDAVEEIIEPKLSPRRKKIGLK